MRKIFLACAVFLACSGILYGYEVLNPVQEALIARIEFNRLGNSNPDEREKLLKQIIAKSPDTEEAQAAYWDLAELYLAAFDEERRLDAEKTLEKFLERYPQSDWSLNFKLKLFELYDAKNPERAHLKKDILNDKALPFMLKSSLN